MTEYSDSLNNKINILDDGRIIIHLCSGEKRNVGTLIESEGRKKLTSLRKLNHVFRKNNSWGINSYIVNNILGDDDIVTISCPEEGLNYNLSAKEVVEKGSYLFFKQEGFEKQIFVPRDKWITSKIINIPMKEKIKQYQQ